MQSINDFYKDLTVIVPAREGSSRVKNKIFLPFYEGLNLLEWKITQLKKIHPEINIIVSSNSKKVKEITRNMGVGYHQRSDFLTVGHQASFSEVVVGIIKDLPTKHYLWTYCVEPLMAPKFYREGIEKYYELVIQNNTHDSLIAVNLFKEFLWDTKAPLNYKADKNHPYSQDLPDWYKVTNSMYMYSKAAALERAYAFGENPYKLVVPKIAGIDIDEEEDYVLAKALLPHYIKEYKS